MRRALLLFALFSPAIARADVVVLDDGQEIRGVVTEEGDRVTVQVDVGTVSFSKSDVKSIEREVTPMHELEEKRARLDPNDAEGRLALGRWAEEHDLSEHARDLYREVIALRPDDPIAREKLGYRKQDGRWMTEEEYLVATGHVLYGGRWVTKEEAARLEREAEERRQKQIELQATLQQRQTEEPEPELEPERDRSYDDGYSWTYPFYGYGAFLPLPHFHGHHRPRPHVGIRGKLEHRRRPADVNPALPGARPEPKPERRAIIGVQKR